MMTSAKSVSVNAAELLNAFEFVSAGFLYEHSAAICVDTGRIYLASSIGETEEDVPEDLDSDRYIAVQHKHELGLGRDLALSFIARELPGDYNTVAEFFRRKGAYGRFKQFWDRAACSRDGTTSKTAPPKRPYAHGAKRTAFRLSGLSHRPRTAIDSPM